MNVLPAADAFALGMLAVIFLSFGVVGLLVLHIRRRQARSSNPEVDRLIEDVEADLRDEAGGQRTGTDGRAKREAWEKDPDWWREP